MVMALLFAFIDLFVVVIFMAIYGKKWAYEEGMLLGVHIPSYGVDEPEVEALMARHHKKSKWFYICNLLAGIGLGFLIIGYFSIFMIAWTAWLLELTSGAMLILFGSHKELYDIKLKHGWQGASGGKIVVIDTNVSAVTCRLPISIWWHLQVLAGGIAIFLLPCIRRACRENPEMWMFAGIFAMMFLIFMVLHVCTNRTRNKVYSKNTDVNLRVNQLEKRVYSVIWLSGNCLNLLAAAVLAYFQVIEQWFMGWGLFSYILIHTLAGGAVLAGIFYLAFQRKEILDLDTSPLYVDDDIYWKNGWYSNPNDKRLWVQDRYCTANYATNMARPAGKVFTWGSIGAVVVMLIVICGMFLKIDFTPIYLSAKGDNITISSPLAAAQFKRDEIESVELLKDIPDDSFSKTNGMADERQAVGKFRGKETGPCRMYIYKRYSPVLKIELPDYTVFINSRDSDVVKNWYEELAK